MVRPLYRIEAGITDRPAKSNAGLWYDKFCDQWLEKWDGLGDSGKKDWIEGMTRESVGDSELIKEAMARRLKLINQCGGIALHLKTEGAFVTGLGRNHPVENGFAWHQILGTPYLPGSSVKGVVRSWQRVWKEEDEERSNRIFGPRGSDISRVGSVIFLDAIPAGQTKLKADVMTPHYGPYYQGDEPPADWFSPVPVPFLVVDSKQDFLFGLIPRRPTDEIDKNDCRKAAEWLKEALSYIGAGAKTAAGYGRFEHFIPRSPAMDWLDKEIENLARAQNKSPEKVLSEMPMKIAESWNKIEDSKLKQEVFSEIKTRYESLWDHPTGGLKKAKKIYESISSEGNGAR